jgi:predicted RND superfamily exporter protein
VSDPALAESVKAATAALRSMPEVSQVIDAGSSRAPGLVATDGRAQLLQVELHDGLSGPQVDAAVSRIRTEVARIDAPRILVGGQNPAQEEFRDGSRRDLERGEMFALPLVILLLLLIFRGLVALTLPLIVAVVSVSGALLILLGVSRLTNISAYSVNVVTMVGLGLAVDYALLLVSRFREERAAGHETEAAIVRTLRTAGRTVAFSGLTVTVALAGLLLFAEPFLRSLAWGAIGVVLVTVAAALSLLPASSPSRQLFETVRDRFPGGGSDPVVVVGDLSPFSPEAADLANRIKGLPGATTVGPRLGLPPTITVLDVTPEGPSQGEAATRLVGEIRGLERPAAVQVTGSAAFLVDYRDSLAGRLPFALGLIALAPSRCCSS